MRRTLLAAIALLLAATAPAAARPRIVGGQPATRDYPFQVFVDARFQSGDGFCGGTLVAARYVVTAGHCLTDEQHNDAAPFEVWVALGIKQIDAADPFLWDSQNTVPADHKFVVAQVLHDPAFSDTGGAPVNDVGVLVLPKPMPETQARLPRPADAALWQPGVTAVATGWGATFEGSQDLSPDLLEVALPIATDAACGQFLGSTFNGASMLCAGGNVGQDTCQGDSGGPLLAPDGWGGFVLAGATSFGQGCGEAHPAVYARVGSDPLNAFVRSVVPQVEIDQSVAQPQPGQPVTFTARPSDPGRSGPFGGYDHLAWDLNGDGQFTEAIDQPSVTQTMVAGANTIAVRATSVPDASHADSETRRLTVNARFLSPVSFSTAAVTVTEGQPAVLTVVKQNQGAGTVVATLGPGTAALGTDVAAVAPVTLTFGAADTTRTVTIPTIDDHAVEPPETFRVDLGSFTGDLVPGTPGAVTVTILDNDKRSAKVASAGTRRPRVRRGVARLTVTTNGAGTLSATAKDAAGHVLALAQRARVHGAGRHRLSLRLTSRGRRAFARKRTLKLRLTITFAPSGGGQHATARRTITLRH